MARSQDDNPVSIQLVPMVDVVFLVLLFCMLSADMSQRVTEDIVLPGSDVKEDPNYKKLNETTTVSLVGEMNHWFVKIAGHVYPDWDQLGVALHELAHQPGDEEAGYPPGTYFTTHTIDLRAEPNAPYQAVQRLIQLCSTVDFYKFFIATMPTLKR